MDLLLDRIVVHLVYVLDEIVATTYKATLYVAPSRYHLLSLGIAYLIVFYSF